MVGPSWYRTDRTAQQSTYKTSGERTQTEWHAQSPVSAPVSAAAKGHNSQYESLGSRLELRHSREQLVYLLLDDLLWDAGMGEDCQQEMAGLQSTQKAADC